MSERYETTHVPDDDCTLFENTADDSGPDVTGVTDKDRVTAGLIDAKGRGMVIAVTAPSGRRYEFLPYITEGNAGTIWIEHDHQTGDSKIVKERTVWNLAYMSRPDVRLVNESDSAFAGGENVER